MNLGDRIINFFRERRFRRKLNGSLGNESVDDRFERYDFQHKEKILADLLSDIEKIERRISDLREQRRTMIFDGVRPFLIERVEERIAQLEGDLVALREKYNTDREKLDILRNNVFGREGQIRDEELAERETTYNQTKEELTRERETIEAEKGTPRGNLRDHSIENLESRIDEVNGANRDRLIAEALLKSYTIIVDILEDLIRNGDIQYRPKYQEMLNRFINGEMSMMDISEETLRITDPYLREKDLYSPTYTISGLLKNKDSKGKPFTELLGANIKDEKPFSESLGSDINKVHKANNCGIKLETLSSVTQALVDKHLELFTRLLSVDGLTEAQKQMIISLMKQEKEKYLGTINYLTQENVPFDSIDSMSRINQGEQIEVLDTESPTPDLPPRDVEFGKKYKIAHREERRTRTATFLNEITAATGFGIIGLSVAVMYGTAFYEPVTNAKDGFDLIVNDVIQKIGSDPSIGNILVQLAKGPLEILIGAVLCGAGLARSFRSNRRYTDAKQARIEMENEIVENLGTGPRHL